MTVDSAMFIAIAEIAGVFVGFGALISVTRRSDVEPAQLGSIRAVVTTGLTVVVAALIPVVLASYGMEGRPLWFVSSLAFLGLSWAVIGLALRARANRQLMVSLARTQPASSLFFWVVLELPIQVPLIVAVLGLRPDLEPALYVTALAFNLFEAAFVLAQFVYSQGGPTDPSDQPASSPTEHEESIPSHASTTRSRRVPPDAC
jgi:Na+/melibiose symporter-like transporter